MIQMAYPTQNIDTSGPSLPGVPCEGRIESLTPEQGLWAAVLRQSREDYLKFAGVTEGPGVRIWREARAWFESGEMGHGTFRWVCELVDLDHHYVWRLVQEMAAARLRPSRAA